MEKQPKEKKPRATNSWVSFVKEYALKKGITYSCALSDPKCKEAYKNGGVIVQEPVMTAKPVVVKKNSTIKKIEPIEDKKPIIKKPMKLSKKEEQDILNPPYFPEYKGKRYEGKRTSLSYVSVDESNEKAPLRKRIHVSALPKGRSREEEILFFTNSDTEEDIKKDIKTYYDIKLSKTFDILPFNELPITEEIFGNRASVSEMWNMPKISFGPRRRDK